MHRGRGRAALPQIAAVAALVTLVGCSTTFVASAPTDSAPSSTSTTTDADAGPDDLDDPSNTTEAAGAGGQDAPEEEDGRGTAETQPTKQGQGKQGAGNQGGPAKKAGGQPQNAKKPQGDGEGQPQQQQVPLPPPWPSNEVAINPAPEVAGGAGVQQRLLDLGFWHNGNDLTVSQAITAVQKYHGLPRTGSLDQATLDAMANQTVKPHGLADAGNMVEVDKARQLLFLLEDGKTKWVFNTSTGSAQWYETENQNNPGERLRVDGITRNGFHHFFHAHEDGWRDGDLGELYRPRYFDGGIAVHGYRNVPAQPASSGCVRVTVGAMDYIWENDLMPMGMNVWVHGPNPESRPRAG